jgi:hypothetical protein
MTAFIAVIQQGDVLKRVTRLNINHIVAYRLDRDGTRFRLTNGEWFEAIEPPEEIDGRIREVLS